MSSVEEEQRKRYKQMATEYFTAADRERLTGAQPHLPAHLTRQGTELTLKILAVGHSIPTHDGHDLDVVTNHLINNKIIGYEDLARLKPLFVQITGSANYNDSRYPLKDPVYWQTVAPQMQQITDCGRAVLAFVAEKCPDC